MNQFAFLHKGLACLAAVLTVFVARGAADDKVFNWTGEAGDGKWSTPGNWQEGDIVQSGVSGDNRVLVFPAGSVSSNDWTSLGCRTLKFTGVGETVVRGGRVSFENGANGVDVTESTVRIENALHFNWSSGLKCDRGEVIFAGPVTMRDPATTRELSVDVAYSSKPEAKVRFLNGMTGATGSNVNLTLKLGYNDDFGKSIRHHLESAIAVKDLTIGSNYRTVAMEIDCPGQVWETVRIINGTLYAGAENVFAPTGVIVPNSTYGGHNSVIDLNGFNQTIDRIGGTYSKTEVTSATPATLTMNATDAGNFGGPISGKVSLIWNPADDLVFDMSGVGTTEGDIFVKKGTFKLSGSGALASVQNLVVEDEATFAVESSSAGCLAGLRNAVVNGTLSFSSDVQSPLGITKVSLGAGGRLAVPANVTITVAAVSVDGTSQADATYSGVGWIDGAGSVTVDSTVISSAAFDWSAAVNGSWSDGSKWVGNVAPDGTKPISIASVGGNYQVMVPDATTIAKPLTVLGGFVGETATVTVVGTVAMADGATLSLGRGAVFTVGEGATLQFADNASADDLATVVEVTDGGQFNVTGGTFFAPVFHGQFRVADGGSVNVTGGTFDFKPKKGSASAHKSALTLATGGTLTASGDAVLAVRTPGYMGCPLWFEGGTVSVTDQATFLLQPKSAELEEDTMIQGPGTIELSGQARMRHEGENGYGTFQTRCEGANDVNRIIVRDAAAIEFGLAGSTILGLTSWKTQTGTRMEVELDSTATSTLGSRLVVGADGRNGTHSALSVRNGAARIGGYGLAIGVRWNPPDTLGTGSASLEVSGGLLEVGGSNADWNESSYAGFLLGNSLPEDGKTAASSFFTATATISGGIVSNLHGRVALGTGKSKGVINQSGGAFVSGSQAPMLIGACDGEGAWNMTGGSVTLNESVYLGIGESMATEVGIKSFNPGTHVVGTAAKGVLGIEAGTFETASDIICGTDGNTGSITVGPAGVLKAKNLKMLNAAADTLTVKVGPTGAGQIELSDTLDLAEGIKLKIDGAATYVGESAKFDLLKCKNSTRPLTELTIEGEIPAKMRLSRTPSRIRLVTDPSGLMLILR